MALREVGHLSGPVVHLDVDVRGVLRVPCGVLAGVWVPDALQVGGLGAGLRRGDEQVAAKLEVVGNKDRVVTAHRAELLDTCLCVLLLLFGIAAQIEADATELLLIAGGVVSQSSLIGLLLGKIIVEMGQCLGFGIAANVIVAHEVGGRRDDDGGTGGTAHLDGGSLWVACHQSPLLHVLFGSGGLRAAVVDDLDESVAVEFVVDILRLFAGRDERCLNHAVGRDFVHAQFLHIGLAGGGKAHVEVKFAGLGCLDAHQGDIVFKRREDGAGVGDAIDDVSSHGSGVVHIERAHVALGVHCTVGLSRLFIIIAVSGEP